MSFILIIAETSELELLMMKERDETGLWVNSECHQRCADLFTFYQNSAPFLVLVYEIRQKMRPLRPWRGQTSCGSVCTGTSSGPMAAPLGFATGPPDSRTLAARSVWPRRWITRACGPMRAARSVFLSSVTNQVMYLVLCLFTHTPVSHVTEVEPLLVEGGATHFFMMHFRKKVQMSRKKAKYKVERAWWQKKTICSHF